MPGGVTSRDLSPGAFASVVRVSELTMRAETLVLVMSREAATDV